MQCLRLYRVDGRGTSGEEKADAELTTPCVLGRGPVLKCAEKKISRRHLILEWNQKEQELVITSVHQNPCFVKGKDDPDIKMLSNNDSATLSPGDKFGLFRESFWFRVDYDDPHAGSKLTVNATSIQDIKEGHSQERKEEPSIKVGTVELLVEPKLSVNDNSSDDAVAGSSTFKRHLDEPCSPTRELMDDKDGKTSFDIEMVEVKPKVEIMEVTYPQQETYVPSKRVRQLPAWMLEEVGSSKEKMEKKVLHGGRPKKQSAKAASCEMKTPPKPYTKEASSPKCATPIKAKGPRANAKKSPIKTKEHHQMSGSEDEETDNSAPSTVKCDPTGRIFHKEVYAKKGTKKKEEEEEEKSSSEKSHRKKGVSPTSDMNDRGSEGDRDKCWTVTHENSNASSPTSAAVPSDSDDTNPVPVPQAQARPACIYGAKCYRKNTDHKKDYAHPGDQDYDSNPDSGDSDTRPECEYGLSCYRRNPQHRKEYKHTRAVQPQRRAKKKARKVMDDTDDDDDGSDLDSFLYDGSSDDYAPTDDDSDSPMEDDEDEKDDSRRLLKEAKKFIRRRK